MISPQGSPEQFNDLNTEHIGLLSASLRAPSAHNVQPWLIKPLDDKHTYEIHYDQNSDLPEDPDSKDAYLTMGAFVETMVLEAPNYGLDATVTPELTRDGPDLFIARVALNNFEKDSPIDPLSGWIDKRVTNRNHYQKDPLPIELEQNLQELGNTLVDPKSLGGVILDAGLKAWANPRYVEDLKKWFRKDPNAEDGITPAPFHLGKTDMLALDFAFWRGSIKSRFLGKFYSSGDAALVTSSPRAAVLSVPEMTPPELFDAGRRLLRSWVTITAAGYSYQPVSVAVDEKSAATRLGDIAEVENPVALYRIGKSTKPPQARSNRKPLDKVLIKDESK